MSLRLRFMLLFVTLTAKQNYHSSKSWPNSRRCLSYQCWLAMDFWFLAIVSGFCLGAMILILPETNLNFVGNGGIDPPWFSRPLLLEKMWSRKKAGGHFAPVQPRKAQFPNPLKNLAILCRKDVLVSFLEVYFIWSIHAFIPHLRPSL